MPERISATEVASVARLARLTLTDAELETFTTQLGDILEHASQMASLDLAGVEPMGHPYGLVNVLRDDVIAAVVDRDEVLASAPAAEAGMFRVPPVMGEEP